MKRKTVVAAAGIIAAGMAGFAAAGPDNVKYPASYLKGTLYATVDRPDIKQYRELYASPGVLDAVRAGKPISSGAAITMVQWSVHQNANGVPARGSDGRFIKKDILAQFVMEKRSGWGAGYPDSLRNGEWEYAVFLPNGDFNPKPDYKSCFECHKPHAKMDFVMTHSKLAGKFPDASTLAKAPKGDVNIASFAFMPAKIAATVGRPLKFLNADDSPHWIVVPGAAQKTEVLLRGQTSAITFEKAGTYDYVCGLHPSMKGSIEVK
jgi:plastocyanin